MFESIKAGGILMIPILLSGVFSIFIIIERCYYFAVIKKRDKRLMYGINSSLKAGNYEAAAVACSEADTPTSQVVKKAIDCRRWEEKDLKESVEAEMNLVVPKFEHLISTLGTISSIATLLGLLGTVTGNIKAFGVLGGGGAMGDPALLANSIAEALVTTVAGLCVSIPSMIFHNFFVSRVNHSIVEMETNVTSVLLMLAGRI
ncbi:MAG: MotA/TolQ/ExbB proton channel family protein [Treponema sp.]|nr:MotA/TolQ/ExbB proton channel family protein [Treponema sp.]